MLSKRLNLYQKIYFYKFVSFDVESLFTNVPLRRTINIILDRVYKQNLIDTTLRKSTLKKLILDSCTKTIFSCNGTLWGLRTDPF
jgi:hypothetical protein